jgi:hypothetical protein
MISKKPRNFGSTRINQNWLQNFLEGVLNSISEIFFFYVLNKGSLKLHEKWKSWTFHRLKWSYLTEILGKKVRNVIACCFSLLTLQLW